MRPFQERRELGRLDPVGSGELDCFARPAELGLGLSVQCDFHALDHPFRVRDEPLRLVERPTADCLLCCGQRLDRLRQVDVLRDEIANLSADGLHPPPDQVRALGLRPGLLGVRFPFRVRG